MTFFNKENIIIVLSVYGAFQLQPHHINLLFQYFAIVIFTTNKPQQYFQTCLFSTLVGRLVIYDFSDFKRETHECRMPKD